MIHRYALDLTRCAWSQRHGDIIVYGSWVHDADRRPRPCLVLLPAHVEGYERTTPCIIPIDSAYLWAEDAYVGDPAHAARMSLRFADALGLNPNNPTNAIRVSSIIRDHIGDLLAIPPMPPPEREIVADAILTNRETGEQTHREVRDDVR